MNSEMIQILILAGIAIFMVMRLKDALGTRTGHEEEPQVRPANTPKLEVIDGGLNDNHDDIADHVDLKSTTADSLIRMKAVQPGFSIDDFIGGARGAYEMILMAFENSEMDSIKSYLADDVLAAFNGVVQARAEQNLTVDAEFIGVREVSLADATFDDDTRRAFISVKFIGEMTSAVRNAMGDLVEGDPKQIKRQKDIWTFSRIMGSDDPNWILVETGG